MGEQENNRHMERTVETRTSLAPDWSARLVHVKEGGSSTQKTRMVPSVKALDEQGGESKALNTLNM